jgi:Na+-transporting NADH:ubiquinone oxidoreductase subunit NqrB
VAVLFSAGAWGNQMNPERWPVLPKDKLAVGDLLNSRWMEKYHQWRGTVAPTGIDAIKVTPPWSLLAGLTNRQNPHYGALAFSAPDRPHPAPPAILDLPPLEDLVCGTRPGGIGETCAVVILVAGIYLIYRRYVKWQLPVMMIASAAIVAAVAPITLAGPDGPQTVWFPFTLEGSDVGMIYVVYQMLSGELLLAAFFLATEMTSRPVTAGGQALFGLGCGAMGMLLQLYSSVQIPMYAAVLAMNTFTPAIDSLWRPRVLGQTWRHRLGLQRRPMSHRGKLVETVRPS